MLIKSLLDITDNSYIFNFNREAGEPDFTPIFTGNMSIWVADSGIVIKGKKICGPVGNSIFKVGGTSHNSPLSKERCMLCRWEDIVIYEKRKKKESIRVILYPNTIYTHTRGISVVKAHASKSEKYKSQILSIQGDGVRHEVLNNLAAHGSYYQDGNDMFFLKKDGYSGRYFYGKVMSAKEFEKVRFEIEKEKEKEDDTRKPFNRWK